MIRKLAEKSSERADESQTDETLVVALIYTFVGVTLLLFAVCSVWWCNRQGRMRREQEASNQSDSVVVGRPVAIEAIFEEALDRDQMEVG